MRSFTYIDDIVVTIFKLIKKLKNEENVCDIYNIGSAQSNKLEEMIKILRSQIKVKFKEKYVKRNKADVYKTKSNNFKLVSTINFLPK